MDPLANLQIKVENYDIPRIVSIFFDNEGVRCWTKAWFCGREKGEPAIEISRRQAIGFINDTISKDAWLSRYYPKQMSMIKNVIAETTRDFLGLS